MYALYCLLPFYLFTWYAERFFLPVCFYRTHNTLIAVHSHFTFHIHIRNRNRNGMTYTKSKSNAIWERNGIVLRSGVMVLSSHISAAKNNVNRTIDRERKTEKETKSSKRI